MKKLEFKNFIINTLSELRLYGELHMNRSLPDKFEFQWGFHQSGNSIQGFQNVVEEILTSVYISENQIYPCVDLSINKITPDNRMLISGRIASYEPREFGLNWTGRKGPFIYGINETLIDKSIDIHSKSFHELLVQNNLRFRA